MAWDTELIVVTRILINDVSTPQSHADAYLQQVLVAAGLMTSVDVELPNDYVFSVENSTITPDPVTSDDTIFRALVPLKAACIIQTGDLQYAVGQGIKVRDGDSMIDTSVKFRGYRDILEMGPCATYEQLKWQVQAASATGGVGGVVLSPYRGPDIIGEDSLSWFFDDFASVLDQGCRRCR